MASTPFFVPLFYWDARLIKMYCSTILLVLTQCDEGSFVQVCNAIDIPLCIVAWQWTLQSSHSPPNIRLM